MNNSILISVIIPVKNGDIWLDNLFKKLVQQTLFSQSEIIVLDSGSKDRSLEIIKQYPVRLINIPEHEFNHGETRNKGVQLARGKYIVMTVQDAVPATDNWLQLLIDGFIDDQVAGVCGQQIVPHEKDKNPVLWFRPISTPQKIYYCFNDPQELLKLSPKEQRSIVGWDNVTAAYRRDLLLQNPFSRIDFAEDLFWAREMLLKGYKLGFVAESRVYHYHHQLPNFIIPRYFSVFYMEYKLFGMIPALNRPIWKEVLIAIKILGKEKKLILGEKRRWLFYNMKYWLTIKKTIEIFTNAQKKSDEHLDLIYNEICKKIPQAPKY